MGVVIYVDWLGPGLEIGLQVWLLALAAVVAMKVFLRMGGLLREDPDAPVGQRLLADRLQLVAMTLFGVGWYLFDLMQAVKAAPRPLSAMPEVNTTLLTILAGSQSVYLAAKSSRAATR